MDAVPVAATDPEAWSPSDDPSYVDVDHIGAPPPRDGEVPQSRLEAVRDAIRRSQIEELDGADASPTTTPHSTGEEDLELRADEIPSRDPVSQLGERAEAILEADDDEPLLATHTDPYPPEEGELADFSGLNDPGGLEDWDPPLEEVSTFGASAPVLTGPMAEESMVGLAVVAHGVEPAVRGTPRSRSGRRFVCEKLLADRTASMKSEREAAAAAEPALHSEDGPDLSHGHASAPGRRDARGV